jgi:DNA (cytosine-5)-methyltransferase 1
MMTVLDLFSGIGGFSLGLERAGMETVAFCETDPFCRKVLAKHWPDVPIHDNIEELDGRQYRGATQLVCGGFPCQPFSVAGNQRGSEDDRALWPEMLRVIREVESAWVVGENVSGIINMELDTVLSDLEDSGYATQSFVVPACAVDAPHRRDRVWIVANAKRQRGSSRGVHNSNILQTRHDEQTRRTPSNPSFPTGARSSSVADAHEPRSETRLSRQEPREKGFTGKFNDKSDKRGGGTSEGSWSTQSSVCRVPDGVSRWLDEPGGIPRVINGCPDRTPRLKSLGNAVVPQVVEALGRFILDEEMKES